MDKEVVHYPRESGAERNLRKLKSFVDIFCSVPVVGPAIGATLEHVLSGMQQKRLDEFVEQVNDILSKTPEAIYESEEFADATKKVMTKCVNENSQAKRTLFNNIYKNYLRNKSDTEYAQYELFMSIADALSGNSLLMLAEIKHNSNGFAFSRRGSLFARITKKYKWSEGYQVRYFNELISQGLIFEQDSGAWVEADDDNYVEIPSDDDRQVSITDVGEDFLVWIQDSP